MIRNKFTVSDISKVFPIVTNFTSIEVKFYQTRFLWFFWKVRVSKYCKRRGGVDFKNIAHPVQILFNSNSFSLEMTEILAIHKKHQVSVYFYISLWKRERCKVRRTRLSRWGIVGRSGVPGVCRSQLTRTVWKMKLSGVRGLGLFFEFEVVWRIPIIKSWLNHTCQL